jgi:hypothetical protein
LGDSRPVHVREGAPALPWEATFTQDYGPGIGKQPNHKRLLDEVLGIADACTRAIANRCAEIEPIVKRKHSRRSAGGTRDEILDDHPLKQLLDKPHPNLSWRQISRMTTMHLVTVGEAYWQKVSSSFGTPTEIHVVPPDQMTPLVEDGRVIAYRCLLGDGTQIDLPPQYFVRFFLPDPANPWGSEGYLGPAAITSDGIKFSNEQLRSHFQFDATPKTTLKATSEAAPFSPEQKEIFAQDWYRYYNQRTGQRLGVPVILPTGYELLELGMQTGADLTPLLEHWRDDMLMQYGVPRSVLGQVLSGDRSSAETNEWVFEKHAIAPVLGIEKDSMTLQLASDYPGNIFVDFDEYMTEDKAHTLAQEESDLDRSVKAVNEVREDRALAPVEWGDEPIGVSEPAAEPAPAEEPPAEDPQEDEERAAIIAARRHYRGLVRKAKRRKAHVRT